jgi:hypothetical protein
VLPPAINTERSQPCSILSFDDRDIAIALEVRRRHLREVRRPSPAPQRITKIIPRDAQLAHRRELKLPH